MNDHAHAVNFLFHRCSQWWHYLLTLLTIMAVNRKKQALLVILLICVSAGLFLWVRFYVFERLRNGLEEKLQSLEVSGFKVNYDSIAIDWKGNVIEIHGLSLEKNPYDTLCVSTEYITIKNVRAEGFRLTTLIFSDIVDFEALHLQSLHGVIRQNSLLRLDSAAQRQNEFVLRSDKVYIRSAHFEYVDSLNCTRITRVKAGLLVEDLRMEFRTEEPFHYSAEKLTVDSAEVHLPGQYYSFLIHQIKVDFARENLAIDSIRIIPHFGKLAFGRKKGYEADRMEGSVPFIRASNFSFSAADSTVRAGVAEIRFFAKIFRDKRLPFRKQMKPLPVDALHALPFRLVIDSLKVTNSYVQYEEFPEDAAEPGGVYFDNLYAVITNIDNTSLEGDARLVANASLMGEGTIALTVNFPLARNKRSRLNGSLQNFPIPRINAMLTPSTNLSIESGKLKRLSFNFTFNAERSDGEIELNYEDLRLVSYKEEDKATDQDQEKDNFKTFIMNTFVFRKNMDENVPEEKRTGTVMYWRDENRSVFNFWIKSLLSGIKSAYKLDEMAEKQNARALKKQEKLARRLERKQKKAERKKDRG